MRSEKSRRTRVKRTGNHNLRSPDVGKTRRTRAGRKTSGAALDRAEDGRSHRSAGGGAVRQRQVEIWRQRRDQEPT